MHILLDSHKVTLVPRGDMKGLKRSPIILCILAYMYNVSAIWTMYVCVGAGKSVEAQIGAGHVST